MATLAAQRCAAGSSMTTRFRRRNLGGMSPLLQQQWATRMLESNAVHALLFLLTLTAAVARDLVSHPVITSYSSSTLPASGPVAARLLQELAGGGAVSSGSSAALDEPSSYLQPAPQTEVSGQVCLDMQLKFGGFCQVGEGVGRPAGATSGPYSCLAAAHHSSEPQACTCCPAVRYTFQVCSQSTLLAGGHRSCGNILSTWQLRPAEPPAG